jgi:hypothetical protein
MSISKKFYSVAVAGLLTFSNASHAAVYDFGNYLTGYNANVTTSFAQLSATDNGSGVWSFMLSLNNNFSNYFGNKAFIGSMSFDFSPTPNSTQSAIIADSNNGVKMVGSTNGTGASGLTEIDFGTSFGRGKDKLRGTESVAWTVSGLGSNYSSSLTNMYLHVQGIGVDRKSAKYTPIVSPVPEPETYAMLLVGLGLVGFSARRRKLNS